MAEVLRGIKGFAWDEGNSAKNEARHGVTDRESEEIFFNKPLVWRLRSSFKKSK